jgi:hypothetical protein
VPDAVELLRLPRIQQHLVHDLVRLAGRRGLKVRRTDGAGPGDELRLQPAPERVGLRVAGEGAQRHEHAAQVVVARRCQSRSQSDERRRRVRHREAVAEPLLERLERRLGVGS